METTRAYWDYGGYMGVILGKWKCRRRGQGPVAGFGVRSLAVGAVPWDGGNGRGWGLYGDWSKFPIVRGPIFGFPV